VSYRTVTVEAVQRRPGKYGMFLSCRIRTAGGEVLWAQCFDESMFARIDAANDANPKKPITLDLANAEATRADGTPFLNIVGYEHPGQLDMLDSGLAAP